MQVHSAHTPVPQHMRGAPSAPKKRNLTPWLIAGGALTIGTAMLVLLVALIAVFYLAQPQIARGVSVAGVDIGGMDTDGAESTLATAFASRGLNLTDGSGQYPVSWAQLGITVDVQKTVALAEEAERDAAVLPQFTVDLSQTQSALIALNAQIQVDPVGGDNPQFGRRIDIPGTLEALRVNLNQYVATGSLPLLMIEIEPPVEEEPSAANYDGETTIHTVEAGQELALIAREYGVTTQDLIDMNDIADADLIYPGQKLTVPAAGTFVPENVPAAPLAAGKSIVVSTGEQRIFAYENGKMVHTHLTSTGRSATPTVKGDFKIYVKYVADDMQGPGYFLPDVPYTMYFYQGYGIHGTYWHNSFGRPMSHGCVNLPVDEAEWFFNWAEVGTLVRVI